MLTADFLGGEIKVSKASLSGVSNITGATGQKSQTLQLKARRSHVCHRSCERAFDSDVQNHSGMCETSESAEMHPEFAPLVNIKK